MVAEVLIYINVTHVSLDGMVLYLLLLCRWSSWRVLIHFSQKVQRFAGTANNTAEAARKNTAKAVIGRIMSGFSG